MRALPQYEPLNPKALDPFNVYSALQKGEPNPSDVYQAALKDYLSNANSTQANEINRRKLQRDTEAQAQEDAFKAEVKARKAKGEQLDPDTLLTFAEQYALENGNVGDALKYRTARENINQEKESTLFNSLKTNKALGELDPQAALERYNRTTANITGRKLDSADSLKGSRTAFIPGVGKVRMSADGSYDLLSPDRGGDGESTSIKTVYDGEGREVVVDKTNVKQVREKINQGQLFTKDPTKKDPFAELLGGIKPGGYNAPSGAPPKTIVKNGITWEQNPVTGKYKPVS